VVFIKKLGISIVGYFIRIVLTEVDFNPTSVFLALYPARPHQVIFNLLFFHPVSLRSLADAQASSTFRASQAEKIAASKFHLL